MRMRGFSQLVWIEALLFLREWQAVFLTFVFLPMLLFIFGAIFRSEPGVTLGGFAPGDLLVPIPIAIGIASNAIYTLSGPLAVYRERGILRRFRVTPLRSWAVLVAQALVVYAMTLLAALLLIALAKVFFGLRAFANPFSLWGAFTLGTLSLFSLGFLLGSAFPTARSTYAVSTSVFFTMLLFGGTLVPLDVMPPFMRHVAQLIPLSYVLDLLKHAWLGQGHWPWTYDVGVLLALAAVFTLLAARMFRWE